MIYFRSYDDPSAGQPDSEHDRQGWRTLFGKRFQSYCCIHWLFFFPDDMVSPLAPERKVF